VVARRERIVAGHLHPDVGVGAHLDGAGGDHGFGEARMEALQRLLAGGEQGVHMPPLRRAGAVVRPVRQTVALQYDDFIEAPGQRARRGQPAHAGPDDGRTLTN
jgi:hypothetical protein